MDSQPTPISKLVLTTGTSGPHNIPDDEVELGFHFDRSLALNPQIRVDGPLVAEHFAHAIAAAPSNLLRHTQRVFFFFENLDSEGLYSALLDLFITLGSRGIALRRRLLAGSREHLAPEHFKILSRSLEQGGLDEERNRPPAGQSILSQGIRGTRKLVRVSHAEAKPERDPLLEAREYIEYFQIDEARDLLEAAIFMQPEREELHIELIHLYQATRDNAGLQAMRETLSQTMPQLPDCWLNLGESESPKGGQNP